MDGEEEEDEEERYGAKFVWIEGRSTDDMAGKEEKRWYYREK